MSGNTSGESDNHNEGSDVSGDIGMSGNGDATEHSGNHGSGDYQSGDDSGDHFGGDGNKDISDGDDGDYQSGDDNGGHDNWSGEGDIDDSGDDGDTDGDYSGGDGDTDGDPETDDDYDYHATVSVSKMAYIMSRARLTLWPVLGKKANQVCGLISGPVSCRCLSDLLETRLAGTRQ